MRRVLWRTAWVALCAACGSSSDDIDDTTTWDDRDGGAVPDAAGLEPIPLADGTGAAVMTDDDVVFRREFDFDNLLVASTESRLFVAGSSPSYEGEGDYWGDGRGLIAELDPSGASIWELALSGEWLVVHNFAASNEGLWVGFEAGGDVTIGGQVVANLPTELFDAKRFLAFMDSGGNLRWLQQVPVVSVDADPRGGIWVVTDDSPERGCVKWPLSRIDTEGNTAWERCEFGYDGLAMDETGAAFVGATRWAADPVVSTGYECESEVGGLIRLDAEGRFESRSTLCGATGELFTVPSGKLMFGPTLHPCDGPIRIAETDFACVEGTYVAALLSPEGRPLYARALGGFEREGSGVSGVTPRAVAEHGDVFFTATRAAGVPFAEGLVFDADTDLFGVFAAEADARVRWIRTGQHASSAASVKGAGWLVAVDRLDERIENGETIMARGTSLLLLPP